MKSANSAKTGTKSAVCLRAILCAVVLSLIAGAAGGAQQSSPGPVYDVPDNIAPPPAPEQPLAFSHQMHLTSGLACQMCHTNPDPGAQMTFPPTQTCLSCHRTMARDGPTITRLQAFSDSGQPIPWVRVYELTPGVTWNHRSHLDAGIHCATCHGDVAQFDTMAERTATAAMASCIGCHQDHGVAAQCATCHAWPSDHDLGLE